MKLFRESKVESTGVRRLAADDEAAGGVRFETLY
jgi:hypothetical protein